MEFGKRLAEVIEEKGLKQNEFCAEIGYSPQKLSNVLTGKTVAPRIDLLFLIAKKYNDIDIRWLLLGDQNDNKKTAETTITHTEYQDLILRLERLSADFEDFKKH